MTDPIHLVSPKLSSFKWPPFPCDLNSLFTFCISYNSRILISLLSTCYSATVNPDPNPRRYGRWDHSGLAARYTAWGNTTVPVFRSIHSPSTEKGMGRQYTPSFFASFSEMPLLVSVTIAIFIFSIRLSALARALVFLFS